MDHETRRKFDAVWGLAQRDQEYANKLKRNGQLEKQYFAVLETLPTKQQDIIQDFVMSCEGISWRMLEVACENMDFPENE